MVLRMVFALLLILTATMANGQAIDNTLSLKHISSDRYIRFNYENDYFAANDKYYTQGMIMELVAPWVGKLPTSRLLLAPSYPYVKYGISLEDDIYTPNNIDNAEVQKGDRPYASTAFVNMFLIALDTAKKQRFSAALSVGLIGPVTGAEEMQTEVHRILPHNSAPMGWRHQVQNDFILNYQVGYERQILPLKYFSLSVNAEARIGTLSDKAGVGLTVMTGKFSSPFSNVITLKNLHFYFYDHPKVNVVGYDATLQGGMFNKDTPYRITSRDICRVTFQNRFGIVFVINRVYLEFFRTYLSREYSGGLTHPWGGVEIAYGF